MNDFIHLASPPALSLCASVWQQTIPKRGKLLALFALVLQGKVIVQWTSLMGNDFMSNRRMILFQQATHMIGQESRADFSH
jgi:hypothetical protein